MTRDVEPDRVRDLLERPPRATVAFVDAGALVAEPVALALRDGGYWVGRRRSGATLRAGAPVMLVVDDGWHCRHSGGRGAVVVPMPFDVLPEPGEFRVA